MLSRTTRQSSFFFGGILSDHRPSKGRNRAAIATTIRYGLVAALFLSIGTVAATPARASLVSTSYYWSFPGASVSGYVDPSSVTESGSPSIPQFAPSLGSLQSVYFQSIDDVYVTGDALAGTALWMDASVTLDIAGTSAGSSGSCSSYPVLSDGNQLSCTFTLAPAVSISSNLSPFIGNNQLIPSVTIRNPSGVPLNCPNCVEGVFPEAGKTYLTYTYIPSPVPAPSSISLFASGLFGLFLLTGWEARRRRDTGWRFNAEA